MLKTNQCITGLKALLISVFILSTIEQSSSMLKLPDWVFLLRDAWAVEFPKNCLEDVNARDIFGNTLLHTATSLGNIYFADFLVKECSANVNVRNDILSTPLHVAVWLENVSMVEFLMEECHAKVSVRNDTLSTPLHLAVWLENMAIVKILANDSESLRALNMDRKTPLDLAIDSENQDIIKFLTEKATKRMPNRLILQKFAEPDPCKKLKRRSSV
jgi:ankyrin repeat protein